MMELYLLWFVWGIASGIVGAFLAHRRGASSKFAILSRTRYLAAATFLMVGVVKWVTYAEFPFFQASGYSEAFYIFVCAFECVAALGLLLRSTAFFTSLILLMEMCGAVYTHFHNYFAKGLADPFGNSLDAFRMLILLSYIAFATRPLAARL